MNGVIVVDKEEGPTSHDIVARVRRTLWQKSVGHAGTLDPMATGVLVVACGEATKLVPYLTTEDKSYLATIELGSETDTLDAKGALVRTAPVPSLTSEAIREVAESFLGDQEQRAPSYSAIKVDGRALHKRARQGEKVEPPLRRVQLREVELLGVDGSRISFALTCSKGFYVRSWARDIAERLGTVGHLTALRRTRSGSFSLAEALSSEELGDADVVRNAIISTADAARRVLPVLELDALGAEHARHGRRVPAECCKGELSETEGGEQVCALFEGVRLVALARPEGELLKIVRGFVEAS